ncbi:hypothetical protein EST92_20000 [Streptomyces sp. TM32]|uniref:hypothetical protein n=1 Tax=Streptomyces sp. TM32 TaxID=1652669 RepID=UPI0010112B59|nr:hypothetical protein [Streptomyces sp. TM32]RXS78815.1 hypothetical protein EST92_20000 [Streptomyces sp. TM32]
MDEETETDTKKKEKRIDLSVAQVAGSALAAAVAAYLAGQLGVYGTFIGAGVVSVVATTGGSIFQHLFRRTGEQIKEASVTTRPKPRRSSATRNRSTTSDARPVSTMVLPTFDRHGAEDEVTSVAARMPGPDTARTQLIPRADPSGPRDPARASPAPGDEDATRMLRPVDPEAEPGGHPADQAGAQRPADRTQLVPRLDERTAALGQAAGRPDGAPPVRHPAGPPEALSTTTYGSRLRGWKRPALGALAVFVLAMGAVTGTELITGQTPNGEKGTSLGNITQTGGSGRHQPSSPQSPGSGDSPDDGKQHGNDRQPSPDPSTSDGADKGKDRGSPSPEPSPSDGGRTSPDPDAPSSPDPSTGGSPGGGDTGKGDGSTGGEQPGSTQGGTQGQQGSDGRAPAPGAS